MKPLVVQTQQQS